MPYSFRLTATIPASPQDIYETWLDSLGHSEMTGGEATMSDELGAEVSAWDGYISGRNLELIPGERIVQSWRTEEFDDEHEDSIVTIVLTEVDDGTLLTLEHSNVPDEQRSYEEGGWQSNYFEPMVAYFESRQPQAAAPRRQAPRPKARRASPKTAAKPPATGARKTKRRVPAAPKRAAPRTKTASRTSKGKGKAGGKAAAASRARARPRIRRSSRRGRK